MVDFNFVPNVTNQAAMAKYMLNQFPFAGLKTPERKLQSRPLLLASRGWSVPTVIQTINDLYTRDEREYQYLAIDLARTHVRQYELADLVALGPLVMRKSWWDSVDAWRPLFGDYVRLYPQTLADVFGIFAEHDNFWMRRVAITLQLASKDATDTALLTRAIEYDIDTDEFFIQKAVGWALRQYSKTDSAWVRQFMTDHSQLSTLAVREGSKYL